jgi:hypothetical protein
VGGGINCFVREIRENGVARFMTAIWKLRGMRRGLRMDDALYVHSWKQKLAAFYMPMAGQEVQLLP